MIGPRVGVRGPNPLEIFQSFIIRGQKAISSPDTGRGKRSEASERVPTAGGDQGLGQGRVCGGQILSEYFRVKLRGRATPRQERRRGDPPH